MIVQLPSRICCAECSACLAKQSASVIAQPPTRTCCAECSACFAKQSVSVIAQPPTMTLWRPAFAIAVMHSTSLQAQAGGAFADLITTVRAANMKRIGPAITSMVWTRERLNSSMVRADKSSASKFCREQTELP